MIVPAESGNYRPAGECGRDAAEWGGGSCDASGAQYRSLKLFKADIVALLGWELLLHPDLHADPARSGDGEAETRRVAPLQLPHTDGQAAKLTYISSIHWPLI